ncbi:MAG TPA: dynamin family protein [Kofleriaceae bacterium]|nr:dynamin family protein [Kofleriaceae bacterium]
MSFWSRIERRLQDLAGELLPDEFKEALDAARADLDAGRVNEAAVALEQLIAQRPSSSAAHTLLGAARLELDDLPAAAAAFARAIELADDLPDAHLGRGEALLRQGDLAGAAAAFRRAQAVAGGDRAVLAAAYRGSGLAHRASGDVGKAVRELRKAVAESPDDAVALAALGSALLADGGPRAEARRHLRRAVDSAAPPITTWLALGALELADGDAAAARAHYQRAADQARSTDLPAAERAAALADALAGTGDAELALGDLEAARASLEGALAVLPARADLHARLGDVLAAAGAAADALACYQTALSGGVTGALPRALDAALAAGDLAVAVPLASRVLVDDPAAPRALLARGRALLRGGQNAEAAQAFRAALERDTGADASTELAEIDLAEARATGSTDAASRAAGWALRALAAAPAAPRARATLEAARAVELGVPAGALDDGAADPGALYEVADELRRLCLGRPELADLGGEAARAASDFDQPLLVTVMGEFSSGKSTFVNAFIGDEVAPTGITPTTATINVVKYGRERGGRILYRDGRTESLAWTALFERLRALDADAARQISLVEVLLPLDSLARVSLVDTPGLNSILPEHEAVAREFIARADAVVWLFSAQQAGKASERGALAQVAAAGVRVLGVVNKVDQLGAGEDAALVRHLGRELGGLVEAVVPVSARRALETGGADPAWQALSRALEERFFARAREIKRQILTRRLEQLLARAGERVAAELRATASTAAARRAAAASAGAARDQFLERSVLRERRLLGEAGALLYRGAAREVLELVVPRRLPFGSHKASRADRDYLVDLLDSGYAALLDDSRRRVDAELRAAGAAALAGAPGLPDLERALADSIQIVDAEVYARAMAYLRGFLEGGTVDNFFRRDLPRLALEEDTVYHALVRDSPDLDAAISVPLATAGCAALDRLATGLSHAAELAAVRAFDLEVGLARALAGLRTRLERAAVVQS